MPDQGMLRSGWGPRRLRAAAVAASVAAWAGSAWAAPGVIVAPSVEAFSAPSTEARVVSELGHGAPVCTLDATSYPGTLLRRPGWLAIRLPSGVGYVPVEAVELTAAAPDGVDCPATAPVDPTGATPRAPAAPAVSVVPLVLSPPPPQPSASVTHPPLLPGRFLPLRPVRVLLGMGLGEAWLDKQAAADHQIGDSGFTLNGTLGITLYDLVMVSGAFAVAFPSDHAPFSEEVMPVGGGNATTAGSDLALVTGSIAVGLRTPFWALGSTTSGWVGGALFAEYGTATFGGGRSISDCQNCSSQDINLPGGAFWRAGIDLLIPSSHPRASYGVTASYQRYAAGAGFTDEFRVSLLGWLQ